MFLLFCLDWTDKGIVASRVLGQQAVCWDSLWFFVHPWESSGACVIEEHR